MLLFIGWLARRMQVGKTSSRRDDLKHFDDFELVLAQLEPVSHLWSFVEVLDAPGVRAALDDKADFVDHVPSPQQLFPRQVAMSQLEGQISG